MCLIRAFFGLFSNTYSIFRLKYFSGIFAIELRAFDAILDAPNSAAIEFEICVIVVVVVVVIFIVL